jgi:uncharacterized coiled-coil DUF342 family protein
VQYASELKRQLESLGEKHRDLLESYKQQFDEAARLNNKITDLTAQINALKSRGDQTSNKILSLDYFEKFDASTEHSDRLYPENEICFSDL